MSNFKIFKNFGGGGPGVRDLGQGGRFFQRGGGWWCQHPVAMYGLELKPPKDLLWFHITGRNPALASKVYLLKNVFTFIL
jgi:hypothetical protein